MISEPSSQRTVHICAVPFTNEGPSVHATPCTVCTGIAASISSTRTCRSFTGSYTFVHGATHPRPDMSSHTSQSLSVGGRWSGRAWFHFHSSCGSPGQFGFLQKNGRHFSLVISCNRCNARSCAAAVHCLYASLSGFADVRG